MPASPFALSVPVGVGLVNGLSSLVFVFTGIAFNVRLNLPVVLFSLIPLVFSAMLSVLIVGRNIVFEKE